MRRRAKKSGPPARRLTLAIDEIGARGDGVGRVDGGQIFVPLTAPGDLARVEAQAERGRLLELVEESHFRSPPSCVHYGACGGCALQHVSEDFYESWKRRRVVEALARAGLAETPIDELVTAPAASRRRATFAVRRAGKRVVAGFNERLSSRVVDMTACDILHPHLQARLSDLKALAGAVDAVSFDLAVTLCRNGLDVDIVGAKRAELIGRGLIDLAETARKAGCVRISFDGQPLVTFDPPVIDFDGVLVTPPPGGFLQASKEGEEALIRLVDEGLGGARRIADLFAGCGSFSLPLARTRSVAAYDSHAASIGALAAAVGAAQRSGMTINPVRAEVRDLFERPLAPDELKGFDAVVFDPPRAGARRQAEALAISGVPLIAGVSCNPATFARDAALLVAGGYRLRKVTPVDQFVYSAHIELVGLFERG